MSAPVVAVAGPTARCMLALASARCYPLSSASLRVAPRRPRSSSRSVTVTTMSSFHDFVAKDINGADVKFSDMKGKVVRAQS